MRTKHLLPFFFVVKVVLAFFWKVGFISDKRRMNVALTRARRGLIIIGNRDTLKNDPTWRAWFDWAKSFDLCRKYVDDEQTNASNNLPPAVVAEKTPEKRNKELRRKESKVEKVLEKETVIIEEEKEEELAEEFKLKEKEKTKKEKEVIDLTLNDETE